MDYSISNAGQTSSSLILSPALEAKFKSANIAPKGEKANFEKLWQELGTNWNSREAKPLRNAIRNNHSVTKADFEAWVAENAKGNLSPKEVEVKLAEWLASNSRGYKLGASTYIVVVTDGNRYRNIIALNLEALKAELKSADGKESIADKTSKKVAK